MSENLECGEVDHGWRDRALWVQDVVLRRAVGADEQGATLLQAQTGEVRAYRPDELDESFTPFGEEGVFRPAFRPVRAISFARDTLVRALDGTLHVPCGDALVEDRNGQVRVVSRATFNMRYRIVGGASALPPVAPFTSSRHA